MHDNIESHLVENRVFKPAKAFANKARIKSMQQYREMWNESIKNPDKFFGREARDLTWRKPWRKFSVAAPSAWPRLQWPAA